MVQHDESLSGLKQSVDTTESQLLMKRGGSADVTPTTSATDTPLGYATEARDEDDFVTLIAVPKVTRLRCEGSVSEDDTLAPSGTTDGYVATATTGDTVVGKALQDGNDGDLIRVLFTPFEHFGDTAA